MPLSWKGWEGQRNKVKKSLAVFLPCFFPCIFSLTIVGLLKPVTLWTGVSYLYYLILPEAGGSGLLSSLIIYMFFHSILLYLVLAHPSDLILFCPSFSSAILFHLSLSIETPKTIAPLRMARRGPEPGTYDPGPWRIASHPPGRPVMVLPLGSIHWVGAVLAHTEHNGCISTHRSILFHYTTLH